MTETPPTFEDRYRHLEERIRRLESGDLGLDAAIACYEEGISALKDCHRILADAEKRIEALVEHAEGEPTPTPFVPEPNGTGT